MKMKKQVVLGGFGILVAGLLIFALRPARVPVSAVVAERERFVEYVEEEGRTALRDPYTVSAPIAGHLRRVAWEVGDPVRAGEVLFELEPGPVPALDAREKNRARANAGAAEARLGAAEAELEARESALRYTEKEYDRIRTLREREAVSAAQVDLWRDRRDQARSGRAAAENAREMARFELENARAVLEIMQGRQDDGDDSVLAVRAPLSGVTLARHRWDEGAVQAGEAVVAIGDLDRLEVRVDLLSIDAVRVSEGMRVILTRWGGDADLPGRVRRVEPAGFERISALGVEEQRVPVWVQVEVPREEWERLGTGYRVEARFILWEGDDVLQVPTSGLFRRDDEWNVFSVRDGRASLRRVVPGRRSGLWSQIVEGVEPGEVVITHPGERIRDGTRVDAEIRPYR